MKKYFFFVILSMILFMPIVASGEEASERIILTFHDEIDYEILNEYALEIYHVFDDYSAVSVLIHKADQGILETMPEVKSIESDPEMKITSTGQSTTWGYEMVQGKRAQGVGLTGKGIKIGVIDSGINLNHPDLKVAGGVSFVADTTSYQDDEGHGTHVAGIISALNNQIGTVGVAPEAELYAIKVLDSSGEGNQSDVVAGIEWAIDHKMDILNLSLTSPVGSSLLKQVLDYAYSKGIIIVASAGNSTRALPSDTEVMFPARYSSVIAVGAIGDKKQRASFSYFGPSLELVAPGENVYSTYGGYVNGMWKDYLTMSGTSMAAPYVSGIAALYKQAYPQMSYEQIRTLMQKEALDLGTKGRDTQFGYGLVQAPDNSPPVFPDVTANIWYEDEVEYLYDKGIISGYVDGYFYPDRLVSRAEAITMIGKALKLSGDKRVTAFSDVPAKNFASGYIAVASERGIISGYPDGRFGPTDEITRGDAALMLEKAFELTAETTTIFNDVNTEAYYFDAIHSLYAMRIISGYPDGTFKPKNHISRAEFSVLLTRAFDETKR